MILKEPDYQGALDHIKNELAQSGCARRRKEELRLWSAGLRAEKQMAYQLRSYFASRPGLLVINNLKIEKDGVSAQIDHLVLTRKGIHLIESKSVSEAISVNEYGEWSRIWKGRSEPMESPVEQAERQRELFFQFLKSNVDELLGRFLGLQRGFGCYTPNVYVAISRKGTIKGQGRRAFKDTVMKSDQICSRIAAYETDRKGFMKWVCTQKDEDFTVLSQEQLTHLGEFLLKHDVAPEPLEFVQAYQEKVTLEIRDPSAPLRPEPSPSHNAKISCGHCQSETVKIAFGRSYYIKCLTCDKNTPLKITCPQCDTLMRSRKRGLRFDSTCEDCGHEQFLFQNPPT